MKWSCALNGWLGAAAFVLPLAAAADSHIQSAAASHPVSAAAHLDFRIVIPQVLSLRVPAGDRVLGWDTVSVMSNGHTVSLNATARAADPDTRVRGNVILSAAARKGIAQDAQCRLGGSLRPVVCTVSMP